MKQGEKVREMVTQEEILAELREIKELLKRQNAPLPVLVPYYPPVYPGDAGYPPLFPTITY